MNFGGFKRWWDAAGAPRRPEASKIIAPLPWSPRAQAAIRRAFSIARQTDTPRLTTEHLLLALTLTPGVAYDILQSSQCNTPQLRAQLGKAIQIPAKGNPAGRFEAAAYEIYSKLAPDEARILGRSHIGTEAVLLALSLQDTVASDFLLACGLDYERLHELAGAFFKNR